MKRKKLPTRRRRALRRIVWAILALLVVNHLFGVGYLLPGQAIRDEEEREGTGRTWTVESRWVPVLYRTHRFISGKMRTRCCWGIPISHRLSGRR